MPGLLEGLLDFAVSARPALPKSQRAGLPAVKKDILARRAPEPLHLLLPVDRGQHIVPGSAIRTDRFYSCLPYRFAAGVDRGQHIEVWILQADAKPATLPEADRGQLISSGLGQVPGRL